ncbi:LOW QUALITY PROTEIN: ribonuclease E/G-like protein, chloroplastic [Salvia miltiorrhiza]|uniref:LOW QUALITY PROTEIN: ribonuclease E/G-like protein, chloroplastic n=1 Tax=Salvia miltiorrhiza TaxID=226208 RepID=UPI0025AD982F|nr:LOW QUALITY PROTEIN: ribonuclease E/G-like protein, chloroplastic [Salvia miltiorrhiza]
MWTSSDVLWGTRVQYSVLPYSPSQQCRKCTGKLKPRNRRKPVFQSWFGKRTQRFLLPALSRDDDKIARCCGSYYLASNLFFSDCQVSCSRIPRNSHITEAFPIRDQVVEEPWLLQPSFGAHHFADIYTSSDIDNEREILNCSNGSLQKSEMLNQSSHGEDFNHKSKYNMNEMDISEHSDSLLTNDMVEEPWIFESACSRVKEVPGVLRNELVKDEVTQSALSEPHHPTPENLLHEEENSKMTKEDSVSTVILINSSICTVQRIAVLENNKLVELLFEPVKNNVLCDSVYLGVVTKLVPHMGGAFVNIGSLRPSFMDIKPYKGPFVFPSFHGPMEETEVKDSISDKPGEQADFPENGALSTEGEEPDEEEYDQSDDEFISDEFEHHGNQTNFDVLDVIKENLSGSIVEHGVDDEKHKYVEHLNGEADQLQSRSQPQDASVKIKEKKWEQVKKGSMIIVQVVKEGLGTKGPTLTAYPKLRSRFWVLMTRCKTIGISKKISGVERTRLRLIAKTLQPPGFGLTVRTVASGHSLEELQRDFEGLLSTWKSIVDHAKSAALAADEGVEGAVPVMLHRAMGQTLSVVQDYFNEKVESMVVDSPRTYHEVTNYLQEIAPDLCDRVELYSKRIPLFDEYNIEEEINSILTKRVPLDNGGYLVIEQTEALVSIDVNGGHCMLGQGTSQEKAILEVNLAAAKQIARESRLRDIGGIIVVDFIDMVDDSNKRLVYEEVKKAVERDRSTVKVSELSRNGLMEITRKRVRPSVTFMISEPCTCCQATGRVEALETSFSKIEHEICRLLSTMDQKADAENPKSWPRFILRVDRHMCNYLTSGKRTRLAVLSSSLKVWILLKVARGFNRGAFELKLLTDENPDKGQHDGAAISVLRPKEVLPNSPSRRVTLFPIKNWKTGRK